MKPFNQLIKDRVKNPERAVREALDRLSRWDFKSGSTEVKLDEVAWLAAVFALGGIEAQRIQADGESSMCAICGEHANEHFAISGHQFQAAPRVVTKVATDGSSTRDFVGG